MRGAEEKEREMKLWKWNYHVKTTRNVHFSSSSTSWRCSTLNYVHNFARFHLLSCFSLFSDACFYFILFFFENHKNVFTENRRNGEWMGESESAVRREEDWLVQSEERGECEECRWKNVLYMKMLWEFFLPLFSRLRWLPTMYIEMFSLTLIHHSPSRTHLHKRKIQMDFSLK